MRVIIAGGRDFNDQKYLRECLDNLHLDITEVVCGMAKGADAQGRFWAHYHSKRIKEFPANWDLHGKSAGYKRNIEMSNNADVLIAFWDSKSRGTKHMIDIATEKGLEVYIFGYRGE